jgi:hypothetical protein
MESERQADKLIVVGLVVSALWLWSAAHGYHPYAYYQFMRWVVCASAGVAAWRLAGHHRYVVTVALILLAILFNPISPIHLRRYQWPPFDQLGAVVSLVAAVMLYFVSHNSVRS